jgi:hypothetical protein
MMKVVAAAAFLAAQWQPAHAQTMLGSIPEEFRTIGLSRRLIQSFYHDGAAALIEDASN